MLYGEAHTVRKGERRIQTAGIIAQDHRRYIIRVESCLSDVCRDGVGERANYNEISMSFRHEAKLAW